MTKFTPKKKERKRDNRSIHMSDERWERVKAMAKQLDISVSAFVWQMFEYVIENGRLEENNE